MAWPGTLPNEVTGTLITATKYNNIIDAINHLGNTHSHDNTLGAGGTIVGTYLDLVTAEVAVLNTAIETTLYTYSLAGGVLDVDNAVLIRTWWTYETDATCTEMTIRMKYGGTTLCSILNNDPVAPSIETPAYSEMLLFGTGATNSQEGRMKQIHEADGSGHYEVEEDRGTSAIDSTIAQNILISAQNDAASADKGTRMQVAMVTGPYDVP